MVTDLPIIGYYDQQRFKQFNPSDCANWYMVPSEIGKKKMAMYPAMGRKHIRFLNQNRLIFDQEPRAVYKSVNYWYSVVGDKIFRIDRFFNTIEITATIKLTSLAGPVYFTFLVAGTITFAVFTDGQHIYVYREDTASFTIVTDPNAPANPLYIATFGNRIVVSTAESSEFRLSEINLGGAAYSAATCFTIASAAIFAQEAGIIRQLGVLQNTLYIFTDFTTGIWSNIPSTFVSAGGVQTSFPWKKNSTYDWDFGMADPNSLDIDFGMMAWVSKNRSGIVQAMATTGQKPQEVSSKAIDVLFQRITNVENSNPLLVQNIEGFLYDYENTIFYRISVGAYDDTQLLDQIGTAYCLEYNFDTQTWHRCIEKNGERNRIQKHVFFAGRHLVTVQGEGTVYEMSGSFYSNEVAVVPVDNENAVSKYIPEPFRYERVTPIIVAGLIEGLRSPGFYAEFITDYVEIDMVFGEDSFIQSNVAFDDAVYLVDEEPAADGSPVYLVADDDSSTFLIAEEGNYPDITSPTYKNWFKPHIELYFSDDGGISFLPADVRQFSQVGQFQWRMRWYQLGVSRNRVYKLICVSPAPIVILGASMDVRIASGGAA